MIRHDLWATPVWEVPTGFDAKFNNQLLAEISKIQAVPGSNFNLWNYADNTECISKLRETILKEIGEAVKEDIPNGKMVLTRGWVNHHRPGTSLVTHNHGNTIIACTYYAKAPKGCGDLLLIDPRGGSNWGWEVEGQIGGVKHKRFTPKESSLVFFPGFLLHSVEENKSSQVRVSISSNLIFA
jgi:uncharacterized protein (TIGR02466 family)